MRSESYAAGGAREGRWEKTSTATKEGTIVATANSMTCGAETTEVVVGSCPTPAAQTTQAVLPALDASESSGWLWSSGSAAKRSATRTIHGESRRNICSINSYHEIGGLPLIFR